jgi:hypothetical protein
VKSEPALFPANKSFQHLIGTGEDRKEKWESEAASGKAFCSVFYVQDEEDTIMRQLWNVFKLVMFGAVTVIALTACGGSGGSGGSTPAPASINGVAAKGAPLANATITLTDSTGTTRTVTTKADGSFTIDVTGLKAPFVLKATSGTITLFSVQDTAPAAGKSIIVNITPITTGIAGVLSTTGKPADLNPVTNKTVITTRLTYVKTFIQKSLAPSLTAANVPTTFDPINDSFAADGTGFDSIIDNVQVAQSPTNEIWLVDKNIIKSCKNVVNKNDCYEVSDPGNSSTTDANVCGFEIATGAPVPCDPSLAVNPAAYNASAANALPIGTPTFVCTGCVFMGKDDNFIARASTSTTTLSLTQLTPFTTPHTPPLPTTIPPTTIPPTTAPPATLADSISTGSANGYLCVTVPGAILKCSYITSCAAKSGNGSGYYQTNLGTYPFSSSSGISAAAGSAVNACIP